MKPNSKPEALSKKGTKLLGKGDREDVLLDSINIAFLEYQGGEVSNSGDMTFEVMGRVDVTDFIDPITGEINIPIEFLTKHVVGFSQFVEKHFQERHITKLSIGLRGDKYRVEWRKKKGRKKEGFVRSALAKAINPEDK